MIRTLVDREEISDSQARLEAQLSAEADAPTLRHVGWQGGGDELDVRWHPSGKFWFAARPLANRYWNAFGLDRPGHTSGSLTLTAEVNPPLVGLDRRVAGAFGRDESGEIFLLHRGKVGGGRKGVGKVAFLATNQDSLESISDGGATADVFVIGRLGDPYLALQIANFLDQVAAFKDMAQRGLLQRPESTKSQAYHPEHEGTASASTIVRTAVRFRHGAVIRVLREALRAYGLTAYNDRERDLYIPAAHSARETLFEAKTSVDLQSLYTAVGQLVMHSDPTTDAARVAVLPSSCPLPQLLRLRKRGFLVLLYNWDDGVPVLENLDEIVSSLNSA